MRKDYSGRVLGASWGDLEASLMGFGLSWGCLGGSGGGLGSSWGGLGAVLGALGAVLGPLGAVLWRHVAAA